MHRRTASLLSLVTVIAMLISMLASCATPSGDEGGNNSGADERWATLDDAALHLTLLYNSPVDTPSDYTVVKEFTIENTPFTVSWHSSDERITTDDSTLPGYCTIRIPDGTTEFISYTLTATITDRKGETTTVTFNKVIFAPDPDGSVIPSANAILNIKSANELGAKIDGTTPNRYYITGVVQTVKSADYGSMYICDDDGNRLFVYGIYNYEGSIEYSQMEPKPKAGDTVTLYGAIGNDHGAAQMVNARVLFINGVKLTPEEPDTSIYTLATDVTANEPYRLGLIQTNEEGRVFYITGEMNGVKLATTRKADDGCDVYIEETDGGYYLYTVKNEIKQYINVVYDGAFIRAVYEELASTVYSYDREKSTLLTKMHDAVYVFGTRDDAINTDAEICELTEHVYYCQFYVAKPKPPVDDPILPPDGSEENPFIIDSSHYSFTNDGLHNLFYKFTATTEALLTLHYPDASDVLITSGYTHDETKMTYTVHLFAGESTLINVRGLTEGVSYSYTVVTEEIKATAGGEGYIESPYVLPSIGSYICNTDDWTAVWHSYVADVDGIITVSSTLASAWIQVGQDASSASGNSNNGTGESVRYLAKKGDAVLIGISDWGGNATDVHFALSFEAVEKSDVSHLAGIWAGQELTSWGDTVDYIIALREDGVGRGVYDAGYGKTYFDITELIRVGDEIILKTMTDDGFDGYKVDIFFTYTEKNGNITLETQRAMYWYPLTLSAYDGEIDDELAEALELVKKELIIGENPIEGKNTQLTFVAPSSCLLTLSLSGITNGEDIFTYFINELEGKPLLPDSSITIGLRSGDTLTIFADADGNATVSASFKATTVDQTSCDFSTVEAGVQYANETVSFKDITVSTHDLGCYINNYLRIYDGNGINGHAIITSDSVISCVSINAGYKDTELLLYASADGRTWTLVEALSITEAYAEQTLYIDTAKNYTYLKLDANGAQVRIASIEITTVDKSI